MLCRMFTEALGMVSQIREASVKSEDRMSIDKKQYLFEAKLNQQLNRPNLDIYKRLCKQCPEYTPTYLWIRKEAIAKDLKLKVKDDGKDKELSEAFNNKDVPDKKFEKMLVKSKEDYSVFSVFSKKVRRIGEAEEKIDIRKKIELSFSE